MTVLGEDPGVEIVVSKYVSDAGDTTYAWNTGLPNVIAASVEGENGDEHIDSIAAPTVTVGGTTDDEKLYLIATGW
ncbi:MAG: hypothetical protein U9N61_02195 [Euryarchaeota archaeon]|nr:hypothetical protein [Euryarchaeota archaeon]